MLQVNNIVKSYGKVKAVSGLSFEVKDGEIFGLLGENGAGKTTTFRIILGLLDADSGSVTLNGKKIYTCFSSISNAVSASYPYYNYKILSFLHIYKA